MTTIEIEMKLTSHTKEIAKLKQTILRIHVLWERAVIFVISAGCVGVGIFLGVYVN